jgi:hypothetical protein
MNRAVLLAATTLALSLGAAVPSAQRTASAPLTHIDPRFMLTVDEAQRWHSAKDVLGPALSGTPSWQIYLTIVEAKLRAYGAVDLTRQAWTYDRWSTTEWPDDANWSLVSAGARIRVAHYGANSGSTPPEGVTAPLVSYDPAHPPASIAGKIAVVQTRPEDEAMPANERFYVWPGDYLYLSNPETFPDPTLPFKVSHHLPVVSETRQLGQVIPALVAGKAAGAVFVFNTNYGETAGVYTFGVPAIYPVPTLILDRTAGRQVIADAKAGRTATLRLVATVDPAETYQLIAYLPGKDYGTPRDQKILFTTHTDGPSISQENGAFGLLGVARYFSHVPQAERPRTLMFFFDNRHFMPGAERAFAKQNWFDQHAEAWNSIVATVGMEHLGQLEYAEQGEAFTPTGLVEHSRLHAANNQRLIDLAIKAVKDNGLRRVTVECVDRPAGVNGHSMGTWFGLGAGGRFRGLPAYAIMGDMSAYWSTAARLTHFDAKHFVDQVATITQLTGELMAGDLGALKPIAPPPRQSSGR